MPRRQKVQESPVEQTKTIKQQLRRAFGDLFKVTSDDSISREKGYYGVMFVNPSRNVRTSLSVEREMLVLISTFEDQQTRTIQTARELIEETHGRLDISTFIVVHKDPRGNSKLKNWGREQGIAVLPVYFNGSVPSGPELLKALSYELYSYDLFDVTGPVADDEQFYGRREEAINLSKKLQQGQIRACFGIRKIGKTSILYRVMNEVKAHYDCDIILIDAQRDAIFELDAGQLINSISMSLTDNAGARNIELRPIADQVDLPTASERLREAISNHPRQILLVFDEIDFITPTSPTAPHWRSEFNKFWRNLRSVYQTSVAGKRNLSLMISGVSSKWFSEESIDGVENSVLAFVPEEYLNPLPRGAAVAMIRRLGKAAGLIFSEQVATYIALNCADMPFWIRKACSYLHSKIEVGLRPFELQQPLVEAYLQDFVSSDGVAMSEVALAHLFRVYPELKEPALKCYAGETAKIGAKTLRLLEKYGIVRPGPLPAVTGQMMVAGMQNFQIDAETEVQSEELAAVTIPRPDYGDWADELAIISRRRNVLERKLRGVVANFLRFSSMNGGGLPAKDRVLVCVDAKRRSQISQYELEELVGKLFWLELISVIKKEWALFEKIFGDKAALDRYTSVVNERPDAHAKTIDLIDVAYHRSAITWFEEKINRL